jgi:hypothetical protein
MNTMQFCVAGKLSPWAIMVEKLPQVPRLSTLVVTMPIGDVTRLLIVVVVVCTNPCVVIVGELRAVIVVVKAWYPPVVVIVTGTLLYTTGTIFCCVVTVSVIGLTTMLVGSNSHPQGVVELVQLHSEVHDEEGGMYCPLFGTAPPALPWQVEPCAQQAIAELLSRAQ